MTMECRWNAFPRSLQGLCACNLITFRGNTEYDWSLMTKTLEKKEDVFYGFSSLNSV